MGGLAASILKEVLVVVEVDDGKHHHRPSVGDFVKVVRTGHAGKITRDFEDEEPYRVQGVDGYLKEGDVVLVPDPDKDLKPEEEPPADVQDKLFIEQVTAAFAPHRLGHLAGTALRETGAGDVLRGAQALMASPAKLVEFEALPEERAQFEWRRFVDGKWRRLPVYAESVLEHAFLCGAEKADVDVEGCRLAADIKNFKACESTSISGRSSHANGMTSYRLTRFLRGQPSSTPDTRTPENLVKQLELPDIEEVVDCEAVTVRTMIGKVVFSARKDTVNFGIVRDLLEVISVNVGKPVEQLTLIGQERLEPQVELRTMLQVEGNAEFTLIICEKKKIPTQRRDMEDMEEMIPEDMPGEISAESW